MGSMDREVVHNHVASRSENIDSYITIIIGGIASIVGKDDIIDIVELCW